MHRITIVATTNLTKEIVAKVSPLEWGGAASRDGQIDYLKAGIIEPSIMKRARSKGHTNSQVFQTQTLDLQIPPRMQLTMSNGKR